ncbi:hypothetical protein [Bradyrhizobium valentinum]|uniref:hypothetical protein n=1 Tax=Bradyrhizobium valentinum TaxID=1518501 RepID=UPI0012E39214|nr:hypothetical protein [Bradyrhizobium valentinum]
MPFAAGIEGNPAAVLPPGGAHHFRLLRDGVADADAIGHGYASRLVDLTEQVQRARQRLAQVKGQFGVSETHPEYVAQVAIIANAEEELARLNVRIAAHQAIAGPRRELLGRIEGWLRSTAAGHDIVDIELVDPPKLLKAETPATAVDRLRRRLRELDADAHRINSAPFPSSFAKSVAENYINQLADAATPHVSSLVEHGGPLVIDGKMVEPPIVFPTKMTRSAVDTAAGRVVSTVETPDTIGLMAWLFRDQMLARIGEAIDAEAEDKIALSHEERAQRLAVIKSDREHVEQEEAHWLWQAFAAGVVVEPRADMAPDAFLGVQAIRASRPAPVDHAAGVVAARDAHGAGQPIDIASLVMPMGRAAS